MPLKSLAFEIVAFQAEPSSDARYVSITIIFRLGYSYFDIFVHF